MSRGISVVSGLVLIGLGAILFMSAAGWLRVDFMRLVLPVLLILLGFLTLWTVVHRGGSPERLELQVPLDGAKGARLRFRFGAGRLTLRAGAQAGHLIEVSARGGARVSTTIEGDQRAVELWVPAEFLGDIVAPWRWWGGEPPRWDARLRGGIPLRLDFEIGACEADLDLTDLAVGDLRLATGASSTIVRMPAAARETRARITAGAASVRVVVPRGVAARIVAEAGLGEVKVDTSRFRGAGPVYQSDDYSKAKHRVDLSVEVGAASVEIG